MADEAVMHRVAKQAGLLSAVVERFRGDAFVFAARRKLKFTLYPCR